MEPLEPPDIDDSQLGEALQKWLAQDGNQPGLAGRGVTDVIVILDDTESDAVNTETEFALTDEHAVQPEARDTADLGADEEEPKSAPRPAPKRSAAVKKTNTAAKPRVRKPTPRKEAAPLIETPATTGEQVVDQLDQTQG